MRMTRATVQLQFMLNCRLSTLDRYPIRLGDLIVMPLDGKALPEVVAWSSANEHRLLSLPCVGLGSDRTYFSPALIQGWVPQGETWRCILAVDPAGRGTDELAWAVVAELNGNLFLLESGGTTRGYEPEVLQLLADKARRWKVNGIVAESNMGDGMFTALLQPVVQKVHPCAIEEKRVSGQKERRIVDVLAPLVQQHRLVVNQEVVQQDWTGAERDPDSGHPRSLMYQLSRITIERGALQFDDRIYALSLGCGWFVEAAAQAAKPCSTGEVPLPGGESIMPAATLEGLDMTQAERLARLYGTEARNTNRGRTRHEPCRARSRRVFCRCRGRA